MKTHRTCRAAGLIAAGALYLGLRRGTTARFDLIFAEPRRSNRTVTVGGVRVEDDPSYYSSSATTGTFCLSWDSDFDVDRWWTHHPEWEEGYSNDTHSCFDRITNDPDRVEFLQNVYGAQWHRNCSTVTQKYIINSGYGASFYTVLKAFYATMIHGKFNDTFQMTKHWDGATWLFATQDNASWAYCQQRDMTCYLLPLTDCPPQYRARAGETVPNYREDGFPNVQPYEMKRREFSWLRRYMGRYRNNVRKRIYDTLRHEYPPEIMGGDERFLPCTVMHVRRGDVGLPRPPFRRYAAVAEYLEVGRVQHGDNIVLLTDDDTTIREVETYHPQYHWIYSKRPRNHGAEGGFDGHVPSKDPAFDLVALLAELRLASRCTKLVHGKSGFASLIKHAMEDDAGGGGNLTTHYLDTGLSKDEARRGGAGIARGESMIREIEAKMQQKAARNETAVIFAPY